MSPRPPVPARRVPGSYGTAEPLVARRDPDRYLPRRAESGGRVRRFVRRYGWRAYAVPLLTVATLLALVDVAATSVTDPAAGTESSAAVPSTLVSGASTPADPPAETPAPAVGEGLPADVPPPRSSRATSSGEPGR